MEAFIFDTHAHYTSEAFDQNRDELLQSLPGEGVAHIVDCATDFASAQKSLAISREYDWIYTAAGIHPESLIEEDASTQTQFKGDWKEEMKAIEALYDDPKVVAVGECGLDHHWPIPKDVQLELFEAEIKTTMERDLPIIVHDREAHGETYALLKKYRPKGVLHAFSGSAEDVKWLTKQGMYIGFTGVVTFKNAQRPLQAAAAVPDEMLVLETDCPYMAPVPFRGKKSHSGMIRYTAEKIAEIRGTNPQQILKMTCENAKRLYDVSW